MQKPEDNGESVRREELGEEREEPSIRKGPREPKKQFSRKDRKREEEKQKRAEVIKGFSKKLLDKYGRQIKAIVAWGSVVRDEFTSKSDIDLVVIADDTREPLDDDDREEMNDFMAKTAKDVDKRLSPQPIWSLTEFWDMTRRLTPLAYNLLKDGVPVYDTGFFLPTKRLLQMGRIPATKEAAESRMEVVPKRLRRAKDAKLWMVAEDVYNAMLNAFQAVIMLLGRGPPGPKQSVDVGRKFLVEPGLMEDKYMQWLDEVITFRKKVEHREISEIKGAEVDEFIKKGEDFIAEMEKLLKKIESNRKEEDIQKSYEAMIKASIAALKAIEKLPEDPKLLPKAFKEHLIDTGLVNAYYGTVFGKVIEMKRMLKESKLEQVTDRDVYVTKEYVRRFVRNVREIIKDSSSFRDAVEKEESGPSHKSKKDEE